MMITVVTLSLMMILLGSWAAVVLIERSLNSIDRIREIAKTALMNLADITLAFEMNRLAVDERRGKLEVADQYAQIRLSTLEVSAGRTGEEDR